MIRIGSISEPAPMWITPRSQAAGDQYDRERDRQQVDRERPDDVEEPRHDPVGRSAEVSGRIPSTVATAMQISPDENPMSRLSRPP